MSVLDAYLYYNSVNNYTDIHILSEDFFGGLLNILYGYRLKNANKDKRNQSGYDLIDNSKKKVFQISTNNQPIKIKESIEKIENRITERNKRVTALEEYKSKHKFLSDTDKQYIERMQKQIDTAPNVENYRVCFLILKRKKEMTGIMNYKGRDGNGYPQPSLLRFNYETDIICIDDLISQVNYVSEEEVDKINRLQKFMYSNSNLFCRRQDINLHVDAVDSVIKEYADNFIAPMFLHTYKPNKDLMTLKNLYVNPKLSPVLNRCNTKIGDDISIVEVLDDFLWNKEEVRMLFIDGDAAIGKTSLISWICYHYKELDEIGRAIFCGRRIICIRLRELDFESCKSSEDCILKYLRATSIEYIESQYRDSVIILEGADELSMVQGIRASSIERFLIDVRKTFKQHKIIITSRPKFIDMQTIFEAEEIVYHFCMQHLDSAMRRTWIDNYKNYEDVSGSTEMFIKSISDLEADGVADTPLALYLLAASNSRSALSNNRWTLYHEIFNNAIITTRYNENLKLASAHPNLSDGKSDVLYNIVGKVALKLFQDSSMEKYYVTSRELDDIIGSHDYLPIEQEILKKSCVLCAYWKKNSKEGALEFYHNDIRDFFFGEYIYSLISNICNSSFSANRFNEYVEFCARFLQFGKISKTTWEQTFTFIYWRLRQDSSDNIKENVIDSSTIAQHFSKLAEYFLTSRTIWASSYTGVHYTSIKNAFINGCLLIKVLIDPVLQSDALHLWNDGSEREIWYSTRILTDWKELLTSKIVISKTDAISFVSKIDLENFDFKSEDLRGAYFFKSRFYKARFDAADLTDASFHGAVIADTSFVDANLSGVDFSNAHITGSYLVSANLSNADFSYAVLENVSLSESVIKGAIFNGTRLVNVIMPKKIDTNFTNCEIINADWAGVDLRTKEIYDTSITHCVLNNAKLNGCRLFNVTIKEAFFSNAKLDKATLKRCNLIRCEWRTASLNNIRIQESMLINCKLLESDLLNGTIVDSSLQNNDFEGSCLRRLIIKDTKVNNLSCKRCDFLKARIDPDIMDSLDLTEAYNTKR